MIGAGLRSQSLHLSIADGHNCFMADLTKERWSSHTFKVKRNRLSISQVSPPNPQPPRFRQPNKVQLSTVALFILSRPKKGKLRINFARPRSQRRGKRLQSQQSRHPFLCSLEKKGPWKAGALLLVEFGARGEMRWWVIVSAKAKGQLCWPGKEARENEREWLLECGERLICGPGRERLQSIKLLGKQMDYKEQRRAETPLVYGFLCEQTNVFYAFQTQQQYQEFLGWLAREAEPETDATRDCPPSEEEMLSNYNRSTEKIMEVFDDPIFHSGSEAMELEEVDF